MKPIYCESIDLPELKSLAKDKEKKQETVQKNHQDLKESLKKESQKIVNKKAVLPMGARERFEKKFGENKTKGIIKTMIVFFGIIFVILLFFQPSILVNTENKELVIFNAAERHVKNVSVFNLASFSQIIFGEEEPLFEKDFLQGKETISFSPETGGVFLITAERQLPMFAVLVSEELSDENKSNERKETIYDQYLPTKNNENGVDVNE